jgi:hypothetical protein
VGSGDQAPQNFWARTAPGQDFEEEGSKLHRSIVPIIFIKGTSFCNFYVRSGDVTVIEKLFWKNILITDSFETRSEKLPKASEVRLCILIEQFS